MRKLSKGIVRLAILRTACLFFSIAISQAQAVQDKSSSKMPSSTSNIDDDLVYVYATKAAGTLKPDDPAYLRLQSIAAEKFGRQGGRGLDQGGDNCFSATLVSSIPFTDSGSTTGSSDDFGGSCVGFGAPDVYYRFTPFATQGYAISLCGSSYDTGIIVTQGSCGSEVEVACNDDACGLSSQVTPSLVAGNTYYIIVDGYGSEAGEYVLNIADAPICDVVCPPEAILEGEPCPSGIDHYNGGCNSSPEVFSNISCGQTVCGYGDAVDGMRDTDLYRFIITTPSTLTWTVSAEFEVSAFILTGECPANVIVSGTALPCSTVVLTSAILPADTYFVFVAPSNYSNVPCGEYVATLTCRLTGDNCASIINIPSLPYIDSSSTVGANDDFHCGGNISPDIVYSFACSDSDSTYVISLCGSLFNTRLEVRAGGACPGSDQIACNDDECPIEESPIYEPTEQSELELDFAVGTTYYIVVDGAGSADSGDYKLKMSKKKKHTPPDAVILGTTSPNIRGTLSVAVDCEGALYFTENDVFNPQYTLNVMDVPTTGVVTRSYPTRTSSGQSIDIQEMTWDGDRCMLWGGSELDVYQVDPHTGLCTFQFSAPNPGSGSAWCDGLSYDATDGTLWRSLDQSNSISHYDLQPGATFGQQIGSLLIPYDWDGDQVTDVSGICVDAFGGIYIARLHHDGIIRLNKNTGAFISDFKSYYTKSSGEGLECDAINFYPRVALWSRDPRFGSVLIAYQIPDGSCSCLGLCCYCDSAGQQASLRISESECEVLGGIWLLRSQCSDSCPHVASVRPLQFGVSLSCSSGIITPNTFTFNIPIHNFGPNPCQNVSASMSFSGSGPGGIAYLYHPTFYNLGTLAPQGTAQVSFNGYVPDGGNDHNGGCVNFTLIVDSDCCGPDTSIFCVYIPPCHCPYNNQDQGVENNSCSEYQQSLLCPSSVCGNINPPADEDWYHISVGCARLELNVYGNDFPGKYPFQRGLNPQVELYYDTGNYFNCIPLLVAAGDSTDGADHRHLLTECLPEGSYFIRVTGISNSTGPYILQTECLPCSCFCPYDEIDPELPGYDNDLCSPATYFCPLQTCSHILPAGDVDWYAIYLGLEPCTRMTIEVYADPVVGNLNPYFELLESPTGNCDAATRIGAGEVSANGKDSYLSICLPADAGSMRRFIRVSGSRNSVGPYTLRAICSPCTCLTPCVDSCDTWLSNLHNWWPLDETSLGPPPQAQEIVNNQDGTWVANPIPWVGKVAGALRFFQEPQCVQVPDHPLVNVYAGDFTLDAWVYVDGDQLSSNIAGKMDPTKGFVLYYNANISALGGQVKDLNGNTINITGGPSLLNDWFHVAMTFDQTSTTDILRLYVNGALVAQGTASLGSLYTPSFFGIASTQAIGLAYFRGIIDEVELFRRVLREDEILKLYDADSLGKCKEVCHLPWKIQYCLGQNTITIGITLCNFSGTSYTYEWAPFGVTPYIPECPYAPPTIFNPNGSPSILVPAGTCVTIPLTITKPAGIGANDISCYFVKFINTTTNDTFCCSGSIWGQDKWCLNGDLLWPSGALTVPVGRDTTIFIHIRNDEEISGIFTYTLEAMSPDPLVNRLSINGLPVGTNYSGSLAVPLGDSASISLTLRFTEPQPLTFYDLLVGWDMNDDNIPEFPFSFIIQSGEDFTPLATPVVTIRYVAGTSDIILDWDFVSDAAIYNVYFSNSSSTGPWTLLGTTTENTYTDTGAINTTDRRFYYATAGN